eukprot:8919988-Alexandrium_andersonii.AAC.1
MQLPRMRGALRDLRPLGAVPAPPVGADRLRTGSTGREPPGTAPLQHKGGPSDACDRRQAPYGRGTKPRRLCL